MDIGILRGPHIWPAISDHDDTRAIAMSCGFKDMAWCGFFLRRLIPADNSREILV